MGHGTEGDNDRAFGAAFKARVRAMGIRDRPTSFRSPWQNGLVERLIGSARRECTDHVIVFNEDHLRRILSMGDALKRVARYSRITNEALVVGYREGNRLIINLSYSGVPRHSERHQIEFCMFAVLRLCRVLTG